jgi:hypothetical protein
VFDIKIELTNLYGLRVLFKKRLSKLIALTSRYIRSGEKISLEKV